MSEKLPRLRVASELPPNASGCGPAVVRQILLKRFDKCLRYKVANRWHKPLIDPVRFLRNQFLLRLFPGRIGSTRSVPAFHLRHFTIVNGEAISRELAFYGLYEPALTSAFLRLAQPGWVAVDIGMHLGYYTTLLATLAGERGAVHAFEPTPSTREIAAENVGQFKNVTAHPLAVWSSAQTLTFHDYGPQWMAFNSFSSARTKDAPEPRAFTAETIALDAFRSRLGRKINLVKIDAESAELEILKGAQGLLASDRPLVSMEVGDGEAAGYSRRLIEFLQGLGYDAWEVSATGFVRHHPREHYEYDNLIVAPSDRDLSTVTAYDAG